MKAAASINGTEELHPDVLSVVYSAERIAEAVEEMGRQLAEEYAEKRPLLLGALTGAFTFTADLARAMTPVPTGMSVDFFSASSYGAGATVSGDVKLQMGGKIAVEGRHILVVEDIIDTGKTLRRVCDTLAAAGAASVKVVVLLDKAERRTVDIQPDYRALHCPNEFVVGYGLDFDEHYRSLPYIGVLRPECYAHLGEPH